jgi:hypothetical protein
MINSGETEQISDSRERKTGYLVAQQNNSTKFNNKIQ